MLIYNEDRRKDDQNTRNKPREDFLFGFGVVWGQNSFLRVRQHIDVGLVVAGLINRWET